MTAPRLLSPFVRTRTRLASTLGLVLAALTAALLPWWQPAAPPTAQRSPGTEAKPASTPPRDERAAMTQAKRTGKQVLVETATTATELTWALPNGRLRSQIHALPQRAKNARGHWAPIDNTLERTEKAPRGLGIRPVNAPLPVRFSSGDAEQSRADRSYARAPQPGDTVLAEMDVDGHTVAYTWPGALPEPVLDGARALYPEVLPGVDLLLVARDEGGFAQLLIVKTREAARQSALKDLAYGLRSETAVFRHDEAGSMIRVLAKDGGKEIASLPTPFGWDSSGRDPETPEATPRTSVTTSADVLKLSGLSGIEPGAKQAPLPTRLDGAGTGTARLHLDAAASGLFDDKDTRFPVFLDPPLNTATQHWTTAYKPYPNSSFWNGTNFYSGTSDARVGYESDTGGLGRSFWRMNFNPNITKATVHKASFKVLNNHSYSCDAREFQFYLTGSISTGTTWNAQPSWATELERKSFAHGYRSNPNCGDAYEVFDDARVKAAVQKGATAGWPNITFGMRATSEGDNRTWRKFRASTAVLEAEYNTTPSEPTNGVSVPGGTCAIAPGVRTIAKSAITLSANAKDADNNLKQLRFRVTKVGASTYTDHFGTTNASGTASVPVSGLVHGATYTWVVRAEDHGTPQGLSSWFPLGDKPCQIKIDTTAPTAPDVTSTDFPESTPDGQTWAKVKFGGTGAITFDSAEAAKFRYSFEGVNSTEVAATGGKATIAALKPPHAGPNGLQVWAIDAAGNTSARTDYAFYVRPRDTGDGPGDVGGDGIVDLLIINAAGQLESLSGGPGGELYQGMPGSYVLKPEADDPETLKAVDPPLGHWYNSTTGKTALISKYQDVYPGDGSTDLFSVAPDGTFWLYPGDGYGTFNVDDRIDIRLPAGTPAPSTWTQIKAVGDITGDKLTDVIVRAGADFWTLSGYTGATFQTATKMSGENWSRRDFVNLADIDQDTTPDLLWRDVDTGVMYIRHGKPGGVAGSVDLNSLMTSAKSRQGDVQYGTGWTAANVSIALGIPDVNGDKFPDIWTRVTATGYVNIYNPDADNTNAAVKTVLHVDWRAVKAFG